MEEATQATGQTDNALNTQSVSSTTTGTSEQTQSAQNPTQQNSQPERFNEGDGNVFNPKNYIAEGIDGPVAEKINKAIKVLNADYTRKTQELAKQRKEIEGKSGKYSYNSVQDLISQIENDKNLQAEIESLRQRNAQIDTAVMSPSENIEAMLEHWETVPVSKQNEFFNALAPSERLTFRNALAYKQQSQQEAFQRQVGQINQWDEVNSKKYSDYKELTPKIEEFLKDFSSYNPREMAYFIVSRETYGKNMYEKGLKEAGKISNNINTTGIMNGSGGAENISKLPKGSSTWEKYLEACREMGVDPKNVRYSQANR
jgi:hypothetical protein